MILWLSLSFARKHSPTSQIPQTNLESIQKLFLTLLPWNSNFSPLPLFVLCLLILVLAGWLVGWLAGWLAGFRPNSHSCPWRQYLWMNQEAFLSHCVSPSSIRWRTSNRNIPVYHLLPALNLRASLPNIEIRSVGRWTGMRMTRCAPNVIPLLRNIVLLTYFPARTLTAAPRFHRYAAVWLKIELLWPTFCPLNIPIDRKQATADVISLNSEILSALQIYFCTQPLPVQCRVSLNQFSRALPWIINYSFNGAGDRRQEDDTGQNNWIAKELYGGWRRRTAFQGFQRFYRIASELHWHLSSQFLFTVLLYTALYLFLAGCGSLVANSQGVSRALIATSARHLINKFQSKPCGFEQARH